LASLINKSLVTTAGCHNIELNGLPSLLRPETADLLRQKAELSTVGFVIDLLAAQLFEDIGSNESPQVSGDGFVDALQLATLYCCAVRNDETIVEALTRRFTSSSVNGLGMCLALSGAGYC